MHEILELNTLLRGEDSEQVQLEKKKLSLVTTVKHQESRFLHEFEEIAKLEKELEKFEVHAEKIFSELLPGLNIESRSSEVNTAVQNVAKVLQERAEIQNLINEARNCTFLMNANISDLPSEEEIIRISVVCDNNRKIEELNENIQKLQGDCLKETETEENLQMETNNLENFQAELETNILQIHSTCSDILKNKGNLIKQISQIEKEISNNKQKESSLSLKFDEYCNQYYRSYSDYQNTFKQILYSLEVEKQRLSGIQYQLYQQQAELQLMDNQVRQILTQSIDLKEKVEKQHMDIPFFISKLRILREEQGILKKQRDSFSQHTYQERLRELDSSLIQSKQTLNQIREQSSTLESYIKNPELESNFQQLLQEIQDRLNQKQSLIQTMEQDISNLNSNEMFKEESEQKMMNRENLLKPELRHSLSDLEAGKDVFVDWQARTTLNDKLHEMSERKRRSLTDEFEMMHSDTDKLIVVDAGVEELKRNQLIRDEQIKKQLDNRQRLKDIEVSKRVALLRKKKLEQLNEAIIAMEDALLKEDRVFQSTIASIESKLITKKNELQEQLMKTKKFVLPTKNIKEVVVDLPIGNENRKKSYHDKRLDQGQTKPQSYQTNLVQQRSAIIDMDRSVEMPTDTVETEFVHDRCIVRQVQQNQQHRESISSIKNKSNDKENTDIYHRVLTVNTKSGKNRLRQNEQQEQQPLLKKQARMRVIDI